MRAIATFYLLLLQLFQNGHGYRILGLNIFQGKSHFLMFERLYKELAARGHEVDVVSHFPQEKPLPRYNDLSIKGSVNEFTFAIPVAMVQKLSPSNYQIIKASTLYSGAKACEEALNTTVMQELKTTTKRYDVIITEIMGTDCLFGYAYLFDLPVVTLTTSVSLPWGNDRFGNPDNPSYIPNYLSPYSGKMTMLERMWNTLALLVTKFSYYKLSSIPSNDVVKKVFGKDIPDLEDLIMNYSSLHLVNSHYSINMVRPWVLNVIEVGGLHIEDAKPLPAHLEELLNIGNDYKGVVCFSLGYSLALETLPIKTLDVFFEVFQQLPYKFLMVGARNKIAKALDIPQNVHIERWMPQRDILCHPNLRLFVSHAGLMGIQEAVYCGIPILGFPIYADQYLNIQNLVIRELALKLSLSDVTKESLLDALERLLENPQYTENAKRISCLFRNRPLSAIDTAIYWVEYVIRHKGARHLRSVASELRWYQYYLIDVAVVLLSVAFSIALVVYMLMKKLMRGLKRKKLKTG